MPWVTGNNEADDLLAKDAFALMLAMLLDQQVPITWAFTAPLRLRDRLDVRFTVRGVAEYPTEDLIAVFTQKPAAHRFPAAMARRAQALAICLVEHYGEDPARLWLTAADGADLLARLQALPGFGEEKARIFVALLAKRFAVQPAGWRAACAPFGDDQPRTVADIDSPEALARVKAWKQRQRADGRSKSD